jgi:hypothetical protein
MLTWLRIDQKEVLHSIRTAVAAVGSLLIARFCRLPESYWAAITTIIIMQSTLGAAWTVSKQRFVGTALGAAFGALLTAYAAQLRGDYASHRDACSTCRTRMDDRHPSVPRNFRRNRGRSAPDRRVAGARAGSSLKPDIETRQFDIAK